MFEAVNFTEPFFRDILRNHAGYIVVSCYGVNRLKPPEILIKRVNVAAVKEAVNIPPFSEKVRYRDSSVRGAANVKKNIFVHGIIIAVSGNKISGKDLTA